MKKLVLLLCIVANFQVYAKPYIGDWGYNPCCGTDCYWMLADIWDDNGTNNKGDDVFLGQVTRLICGINIKSNGSVDFLESFKEENFTLPDDFENSSKTPFEKIIIYPNPVKSGEMLFLKNIPEHINQFNVTVLNLTTHQTFSFELTGTSISLPSIIQTGLYQVIIESKDNRVYLQQRLLIE